MAVEYPDVMNDLVDARQRYESGAVQFLAVFSPSATSAGSIVPLSMTLQSVMNVPVQVAIRIGLPATKGKLKRLPQPPFQIFQSEINLTLESAEVVQLVIPVHIHAQVPPDDYGFLVSVRSAPTEQGTRIRSKQSENRLGDLKIRFPQGLGITQLTSWGFVAKESQRQEVSLSVSEGGESAEMPERAALEPALNSFWVIQDWDPIAPARREMNDRRIHIMPQLTAEALFLPFIKQTEAAFGACGVHLHVGEAVFLAKILTYTVVYMASKPEWLDCLLVPIYAFAKADDQPTDDVVWLLTRLGYTQVLEFAVALGFSVTEEMLQRELWSAEEQRGVRDYILGCLSTAEQFPPEFVYLPLILGGLVISDELIMEGENLQQSIRLLAKAKASKAFTDQELQELNEAFDHILVQKARR